MKIKLTVTLDVHLRDYATEYGLSDLATAATKARASVRDAVRDGELNGMVGAVWPAMGYLSTAHVEIAKT